MKSYFNLFVWFHGLLVSDKPWIVVPMLIILSILVAISNPQSMMDPLMFWKPNCVYGLFSCRSRSWSPVGGMFAVRLCVG